jgi:UDP-N-acetylmuramoyl-L-alanyl-D-glutamate--2,6-diaminopimelate ligase
MILEDITPPEGRFQYISKNGITIIVDYAHSPDSLEKVILTAKSIKNENNKLITVFGCGGDRDPLKRRVMGKIGATLSDIAIFTSDNPRYEDPDKILDQMKTDLSVPELKKTETIPDRRVAIARSLELANEGDIILCAGKGHEDYQEIKGVKYPFNDKEEYKKLLK